MIRHATLLLFLFALMGAFGCNNAALREQGELQGKIYVLGNDPFTKVALAIDEQRSVLLLCTPDVDTYLRGHQGEMAKVTYDGTSQLPEGQAVRVTAAKMVKQ